MIVHQLNMSWTVAAEKALLNMFLSPAWDNATRVLVTDVPTFDPMIMGIASSGSKTELSEKRSSAAFFLATYIIPTTNIIHYSLSR